MLNKRITMDSLKITGTSQYPEVILDKKANRFDISGNSLPEDAKTFYEPILQWLDSYALDPNPETLVRFKMVYYNTPSSKLLYQILKRFEKIALQGHKVTVLWRYNEDDSDIREAGVDLSEHVKVPFKFEAYKE